MVEKHALPSAPAAPKTRTVIHVLLRVVNVNVGSNMRTPDEGTISIALSITTWVRFIHVNGIYTIAPASLKR